MAWAISEAPPSTSTDWGRPVASIRGPSSLVVGSYVDGPVCPPGSVGQRVGVGAEAEPPSEIGPQNTLGIDLALTSSHSSTRAYMARKVAGASRESFAR